MAEIVSRRHFLKLSAAAAAASVVIPAFAFPRDPYVIAGEIVSYVGFNKVLGEAAFKGGFTGGTLVQEVGPWDGVGYPCILGDQGYSGKNMPERYYDTDLCNFLRETPSGFWRDRANWHRYPNLHSFVREKRFGEDPAVMRHHMYRYRLGWAA